MPPPLQLVHRGQLIWQQLKRLALIKPTPPQPSTAQCSLIPVQPSTAKYSQYPIPTQNPNFLVKPDPNPTRSQKALLVKPWWGVGVNNLGLPLHTIFCTLLNGFRNGLTGHLTRWIKAQFTKRNLTLREVKSIQLPKSRFPSILRFFGICGPHTPFSNLGC